MLDFRHFPSSEHTGYRFGFNGMEKDDEVKGNGNSLDFGARIYDPRLGRWLSTDPLQAKYAELSPYNFSFNGPIQYMDPDGRDPREGNEVIKVNFGRARILKIDDDSPSLRAAYDPTLNRRAFDEFASSTVLGPIAMGTGVWKGIPAILKKHDKWGGKVASFFRPGLSQADISNQFLRASKSKSGYEYLEVSESGNEVVHRRVENFGEGFENVVAEKNTLSLVDINGEESLRITKTEHYSLSEKVNEKTGETEKWFNKQTFNYTYGADGNVENTEVTTERFKAEPSQYDPD